MPRWSRLLPLVVKAGLQALAGRLEVLVVETAGGRIVAKVKKTVDVNGGVGDENGHGEAAEPVNRLAVIEAPKVAEAEIKPLHRHHQVAQRAKAMKERLEEVLESFDPEDADYLKSDAMCRLQRSVAEATALASIVALEAQAQARKAVRDFS